MEIIDMNDKIIDYFNKQDFQENCQNSSSLQSTTTTSPPSPSTSPTHEFSFTISLHHHHHPQPPAAIDLSPADDIFFQGHLLPLHFPISSSSPRSSTNSMDSYTLPMNLLYNNDQNYNNNTIGNTSFHCHHQTTFSEYEPDVSMTTTHQNQPKSKSFSIFNIPKWKKRVDDDAESENDHYFDNYQYCQNKETNNNKKIKLDHLSQLIKRYMKMVKPALLSFQKPSKRRPSSNNREFKHQSYSCSGNSIRSKQQQEAENKRRGRFSAPASMRTSPANSGILVANPSGNVSPSNSYKSMTSESSMEELHAAIQAAIVHCKNSIAMDTKI